MVYRPGAGTWFRRLSSTHFTDGTAMPFGLTGDVPVPGDYDGDGTTDLAVYRPASGTWFIQPSGGGATRLVRSGGSRPMSRPPATTTAMATPTSPSIGPPPAPG